MTRRTFILPAASAAAFAAVLAVAGPAAAHVEVSASDPRALAKNVTLTFTSEAESDTSGIAKLQIVLPKGIAPDAVSLAKAPAGWKLTPSEGGYTVGGKALAIGTDAVYSITVTQLPDAKSLAFKTIETYGDGSVDRWIELPSGGAEPENPAPVLALKPAAPGATASSAAPTPTPSASVPTTEPSTSTTERAAEKAAEKDDDGNGTTVAIVAAAVVIAAGLTLWWFRRNRGTGSA
ncbi:DUF1775 domain-containing protein [Streptomyces sp. NBC_01481]|uniref:DUF1775 domain-containing protein n=1 Tax=Streptomyces sp. NBC_01481 TaxID=2975869 RepID=UPI00224FA9BC|nr:DUF1775 domain-containing protein [Streptomyces sp. NBC_01481]MCX4584862.1 YcnI family protein [Streptomyces sp. NBC_01481]